MLVVDLEKNKVYEDEELLAVFDAEDPVYEKLLEDEPLVPEPVLAIEGSYAEPSAEGLWMIPAKMSG